MTTRTPGRTPGRETTAGMRTSWEARRSRHLRSSQGASAGISTALKMPLFMQRPGGVCHPAVKPCSRETDHHSTAPCFRPCCSQKKATTPLRRRMQAISASLDQTMLDLKNRRTLMEAWLLWLAVTTGPRPVCARFYADAFDVCVSASRRWRGSEASTSAI